ncbi:MAG: SagB/ThcOx family dehydrogenase [Desulfurococcaceae archaeon]
MSAYKLPEPDKTTSLSQLLIRRKSIRKFRREPLKLTDLSRILWATYGIIDKKRRVVPSAGATYPMEIYVFVRNVENMKPGIYKYVENEHSLLLIKEGDYSKELARACLDQSWVREAPVNIVITAYYEKTTGWYGERGFRYIYMEAGHIGQNIYLASAESGLGTVAVGAFKDEEIASLIGLGEEYLVLYVFPIGLPY